MTPTKDQIKQFYSQGLERCRSGFAEFSDKDWGKKASDEWTAKEHLAHVVGTVEKETLPLTRQALAGEPANIPGFEKREDQLSFRNQNMEELRDLPAAELLQRFEAAVGEHISMLDSMSDADMDKPIQSPAWDRPGTLRDLYFAGYLFLPAQYQEIRKARKKLKHWVEAEPADEVNYHMSRLFNYMPLIFRSDKGADMAVTYLFTMEGEGGGQWNIAIAEGTAKGGDGALDSPDIEIKTKPVHWMDLTMGDLNPVWAITTRKVQLHGNMALAMKLSELFGDDE